MAATMSIQPSNFTRTRGERLKARVTADHQRLTLSVRDSQVFVEALTDPRPVNDRLRETVRRYRQAASVSAVGGTG